jgi:hypothetical protein
MVCASLIQNSLPSEDQRARGMPGAQCTRSLVCARVVKYAHEYSQRRHRITSGIPHAMVLRLIRALPGDRALLPPSPLRSLLLKNLAPASGRQDHTISPSASGAFVSSAIRVHRIPPYVRDDREAPLLVRRDDSLYSCFYPAVKSISEIPKSRKTVFEDAPGNGLPGHHVKALPHRGPSSLADYPHRSCERPSRRRGSHSVVDPIPGVREG